MTSLGIDIGATAIKAGLYDGTTLIPLDSQPTPTNPDDIVRAVVDIAKAHHVESVGVAVAAFLDPPRRRVVLSPNIGWSNRDLADELEAALGVRVVIENDANAAGFGEYSRGAGAGAQTLVMLTLGTGVGGALLIDGQLVTGAQGMAGEFGHIIVEPGGERCGCGQRGCVETLASGGAMMRRAQQELGAHITSPEHLQAALADHPELGQDLLQRACRAIILTLANLQAVVDPDVAVIGGGVTERLGSELFDALARAQHSVLDGRRSEFFADIRPAQLGNQAGVIGAALLAMTTQATQR